MGLLDELRDWWVAVETCETLANREARLTTAAAADGAWERDFSRSPLCLCSTRTLSLEDRHETMKQNVCRNTGEMRLTMRGRRKQKMWCLLRLAGPPTPNPFEHQALGQAALSSIHL